MSKERELLKRVRDTLHELKETHYDLYWDIQAELDKNEQNDVPDHHSDELIKLIDDLTDIVLEEKSATN